MANRSDRARRHAARIRNRRIFLIVIFLLIVLAALYLAFIRPGGGSQTWIEPGRVVLALLPGQLCLVL